MRYVAFALAAVCCPTAPAADPITKLAAPAKPEWVSVQADPVLTTLASDKPAKWILVDDGPACDLRATTDGKAATFAAKAAGHYRVLVVTDADVHRVKLVKADPQPMPGPIDPPKPPDPKPVDPLVAKLQAAFDLDQRAGAAKEKDRLDLVELYKQAADLSGKAEVATAADLVARVRDASKSLAIDGLTEVRKVIAGELAAAFPVDEPLTADSRAKAAALFIKIKTAVEGVK
jgi:hypothetical protein